MEKGESYPFPPSPITDFQRNLLSSRRTLLANEGAAEALIRMGAAIVPGTEAQLLAASLAEAQAGDVYYSTDTGRVRFVVGTNEDDAVLRVNDKIRANFDRIPVGIPEPMIVGRGINDVAVVVLTLSPAPDAAPRWTDKDL